QFYRPDDKIAKSISRAKYIQNTRKAGWDSTNETIKKELAFLNGGLSVQEKSAGEGNAEKEDEEIPEIFDSLAEDNTVQKTPTNRFG
ncbi:Alb1 domain-containing protein, partial [Cutibacterium acnes]|nr:Alb1 domain-containing protein [Cutibacterium acnes]